MLRVLITMVMVLFVLMSGYAVYDLGFGWHGIVLTLFLAAGVLWEIWVQPGRDESYRQQILKDIEEFDLFEAKNPSNLLDAKLQIAELSAQLSVVKDAYVELKAQREYDLNDWVAGEDGEV